MSSTPEHALKRIAPYQFFMVVLSVWALVGIGASTFLTLSPSTQVILRYADTAACGLFFLDFLYSLHRAPAKWKYLATWGWIDLLSSIPAFGPLRWGRVARVLRALRVIRGVKAAMTIAGFFAVRRAQSVFFATALMTLLLIVASSIAVLEFEVSASGNIRTPQDAMWWAVTTMSTVGYGDTFPITPEGRLVGVFLMAAGVGLFGVFSGLAASWFLSPTGTQEISELEEIKAMLKDLRAQRHASAPENPAQA